MSYMTISSQEKHHFSLCSYFHAHPTTLLLKILRGTNAWAVPPTSNFWGTIPPVPLGLRPCGEVDMIVPLNLGVFYAHERIHFRGLNQEPPMFHWFDLLGLESWFRTDL